MIKIRYSDLPPGLHARVDIEGRHTVVYLLPGLTPRQRGAALHRVRSSGRMGHGPRLPARGMARALAADQLRTTLRNGASAIRAHPALLIPPLMILVSGALAFLLLTSVSIVYRPDPAVRGAAPATSHAGRRPNGRDSRLGDRRVVVITPVAANPPPPARHHGRHHGRPSSPSPSRSPSPSASATPSPGSPSPGSPSPGPTVPAPDPAPSSGPPPAPAPSPSPPNGGGVCVRVGPLGVCVDL